MTKKTPPSWLVEGSLRLDYAEPYLDDDDLPGFIIQDGRSIEAKPIHEWEEDYKGLGALLQEQFINVFWDLPGKPDLDSDLEVLQYQLLERLHAFVNQHVQFLNEEEYTLVESWATSTYLTPLGILNWPRLIFHGVTGSGKSTAMDTLKSISYRGWTISNATGPALFRTVEKYHTTVFLDEYQNLSKERRPDIDDMIISGFDRKSVFPRTNKDGIVDFFRPFGPMAISTRRLPGDDKQNRANVITMIQKTRNDVRRRIDKFEAGEIRTILTAIRFQLQREEGSLDERIDKGCKLAEAWIYESHDEKVKQLESRSIDMAGTLLLPFLLIDDESRREQILEQLLRGQDTAKDSLRSGLEAQVFYALQACRKEEEQKKRIDVEEWRFDPSKITTKWVTEQLNQDLKAQGNASKEEVKTRTVTSALGELGFKLLRYQSHNETGLNPDGFEKIWKVNLGKFGARNEG